MNEDRPIYTFRPPLIEGPSMTQILADGERAWGLSIGREAWDWCTVHNACGDPAIGTTRQVGPQCHFVERKAWYVQILWSGRMHRWHLTDNPCADELD